MKVVVLPRRRCDPTTIDRGCEVVSPDWNTGYQDADGRLEVNAYFFRKLSAGPIDGQEFLILSWRLRDRISSTGDDHRPSVMGTW